MYGIYFWYIYGLQIVVGGRNKYLINGKLAQPSQVQNLFHSVQLNVNNPHFLIMQGRITKVLNMKPPEILSMLEEAAGTRMYETKKDAALKTLEKKQSKVDEINTLLDQEILPALEKLRRERTQYMQWANGNADLDRLKRFCIAYEYVEAEKIRDNAVLEVDQVKAEIAQTHEITAKTQAEIQDMETKVKELTAEKEASMGGEVKKLSDKVDALSQDLVREVSALNNKEDNLKTEKKDADKVNKSPWSITSGRELELSLMFFFPCLVLLHCLYLLLCQITKNIEDLKKSVEERTAAVKKADDGAADLKKRHGELSQALEEYEKEHQVVYV